MPHGAVRSAVRSASTAGQCPSIGPDRSSTLRARQPTPSSTSSGQGQKRANLRARAGGNRRIVRRDGFFRRRLPDWAAFALGGGDCDGRRDRPAHRESGDDPRPARLTRFCRGVHGAPVDPQQPGRSGPCGPTVQFQRKAPGPRSSLAGEFRQGRKAGADHHKNQSGDTRGDDRDDPPAGELFHEQIQEPRLH